MKKTKAVKKVAAVQWTEADLKKIADFMRAGHSTTAVHKKFGMSSQYAGKLRRKLKIKPPSEAQRQKNKDHLLLKGGGVRKIKKAVKVTSDLI